MNEYEKIKKLVTKNNPTIYKKVILNYHKSNYAVILKHTIIVHNHIDLEVATTYYKFNNNNELIDTYTTGWY